MGKFMDLHGGANGERVIISPEIDTFLESKEFNIDACAYGGDEKGWRNGYYDKSGSYFYRIHITRELVRVHYEYECGGLVSDWKYQVEPEHIADLDSFVRFLDDIYDRMDI